ncbi:MAG: flagellar basal body rod protein FlgC [Gemmatimonadota bacterium]
MSEVDGVRGLFRGLSIPASGLSAQRRRIDVISMNIANAEATGGETGTPYQRRILRLAEAQSERLGRSNGVPVYTRQIEVPDVPEAGSFTEAVERAFGVEVSGIELDTSEGPLVYEPGHPDADADGYVRYPNVHLTAEMIDLMESMRAYEANATVFDAMKSMLRQAIQI